MTKSSRLTSLAIEKARSQAADIWLSDDEGTRGNGRLVVRISPSGSKLFYFRYSIDGVRKQVPMRPFAATALDGKFTLDQARQAARSYSELHRTAESRDVAAYLRSREEAAEAAKRAMSEEVRARETEASQASMYSVRALCDWYVKHLISQGRVSAKGVESLFRCHVWDTEWASMPAKALTGKHATTLLREIVQAGKGRTASKVRSGLHAAFSLALKAELDATAPAELIKFGIEVNPISSTAALSAFTRARSRALSDSELAALWRRLGPLTEETPLDVRGLRLSILLGGQRGRQLLRVRRVEDVDLEQKTITLHDGKGRRRTPRIHLLPLVGDAFKEVATLVARSKTADSEFLFASRSAAMNSESLSALVSALSAEFVKAKISQQPFQFRDLRRTAETMLASLAVSKDVRAQLQSHGISGVQAKHYDQYEYMKEKQNALAAWHRHLKSLADGKTVASNVKRLSRA